MKEKRPFLYSIRAKLLIGFVIVSLISMTVVIVYTINSFDKYISREFSNKLQANLDTALLIYELKTKTLTNLLRSISDDNVVRVTLEIGPRNQLVNYAAGILREKNLDLLTITDEQGIVAARGADFFSFGDNLSDNPLVKKGLKLSEGEIITETEIISLEELRKDNLVSKAEIKTSEGKVLQSGLMLKAIAPVYFEDKMIGVVIAGNLLNNNFHLVEQIKKEVGAETHIFQKDIIVSTTFRDEQKASIKGERFDLEKETFAQNLIKQLDIKGKDYLTACHFLKNNKGELVGAISVSADMRQMTAMKKTTRNNLLLISLISILFVVILAIYLSYIIADPIHRTIKAMTAVGKGDLSQKIKTKQKGETGKLIESFNKMTADLKESEAVLEEEKTALEIRILARTRELRELSQGLDEKVKARTKELQDRLAELERFHKLTVGRELKMMDLKKEIRSLKKKLENEN